jgi:hypothetical protein
VTWASAEGTPYPLSVSWCWSANCGQQARPCQVAERSAVVPIESR